jgi:hypothetical protein
MEQISIFLTLGIIPLSASQKTSTKKWCKYKQADDVGFIYEKTPAPFFAACCLGFRFFCAPR